MSTNQQADTRTVHQQAVVNQLASRFQIDTEKVLFLNPNKPAEPWLSAEVLTSIARQTGEFQKIEEKFDLYIPGLEQIVHQASVTDTDGRVYERSGVASIGERVIGGGEDQPDVHGLAASRALNAALTSAGFNPLKAASVVPRDTNTQPPATPLNFRLAKNTAARSAADLVTVRSNDLARIHIIATEKGLIKDGVGGVKDLTDYRTWLFEHYGVTTAAGLNPVIRAAVINALEQEPDAPEPVDESSIA